MDNNPRAGLGALLTPENSVLLLIDHQAFQVANLHSHEPTLIINNVAGLAKSAKVFGVPTILTTVLEQTGGLLIPEIQSVFPDQKPLNRTSINAWEDGRVAGEVKKTGRRKIVIAGLWTEMCVAMPAIPTTSASTPLPSKPPSGSGVGKGRRRSSRGRRAACHRAATWPVAWCAPIRVPSSVPGTVGTAAASPPGASAYEAGGVSEGAASCPPLRPRREASRVVTPTRDTGPHLSPLRRHRTDRRASCIVPHSITMRT